ncbi:MAG: hypothetical protein EZS28_013646, partial [Streblomastix strix]
MVKKLSFKPSPLSFIANQEEIIEIDETKEQELKDNKDAKKEDQINEKEKENEKQVNEKKEQEQIKQENDKDNNNQIDNDNYRCEYQNIPLSTTYGISDKDKLIGEDKVEDNDKKQQNEKEDQSKDKDQKNNMIRDSSHLSISSYSSTSTSVSHKNRELDKFGNVQHPHFHTSQMPQFEEESLIALFHPIFSPLFPCRIFDSLAMVDYENEQRDSLMRFYAKWEKKGNQKIAQRIQLWDKKYNEMVEEEREKKKQKKKQKEKEKEEAEDGEKEQKQEEEQKNKGDDKEDKNEQKPEEEVMIEGLDGFQKKDDNLDNNTEDDAPQSLDQTFGKHTLKKKDDKKEEQKEDKKKTEQESSNNKKKEDEADEDEDDDEVDEEDIVEPEIADQDNEQDASDDEDEEIIEVVLDDGGEIKLFDTDKDKKEGEGSTDLKDKDQNILDSARSQESQQTGKRRRSSQIKFYLRRPQLQYKLHPRSYTPVDRQYDDNIDNVIINNQDVNSPYYSPYLSHRQMFDPSLTAPQ